MEKKIILLRNDSKESEMAEKLLSKLKVCHIQIFCSEGIMPSIISSGSAYAYEGLGGVRLFISGLKQL